MSRTSRGSKGSGYEYWTARPGNKAGGVPGKLTKKTTHKSERQQGKQDAIKSALNK